MVMESGEMAPTPNLVGLEFVRQYYTILSRAPCHLHRFYFDRSSFIHDSSDPLCKQKEVVYGQRDIHERILQLNFKDCYTKIKQIDSHATLGDGIVVQVSGELSNNRKPMRRFMQTFVLGLLSPMKYYVHNDIFRYQDDYPDDDDTEGQEGCTESEVEEDRAELVESPNNITDASVVSDYDQPPLKNGTVHLETVESPPQTIPVSFEPVAPCVPTTLPPGTPALSTAVPVPLTKPVQPSTPTQLPSQPQPVVASVSIESSLEKSDGSEDFEKASEKSLDSVEEAPLAQSDNVPKTYATMASKSPGGLSFGATTNASIPGGMMGPPRVAPGLQGTQTSPKPETRPESAGNATGGFSGPPNVGLQARMARPGRGGGIRGGGVVNRWEQNRMGVGRQGMEDGMDTERRRPTQIYPDSNQLFVGNLLHEMTEEDLRVLFSKFGNVVDVRINTKQSAKPVPSFGFVVFDESSPVQRVLNEKPIFYNDEHRLNVEEKKAKPRDGRMGMNDMRPGSGRGVGPGRGMMGNRGGRGGMQGSMGRGGDNRSGGGGGGRGSSIIRR